MKIKLSNFGDYAKGDSWRRLWKRFGGGWDFKLGIAIGGKTLIVYVGIGSIIIDFGKGR